ncbi:olfactomedin-4-like isoform X1 [Ctenopharyngodon idella]|uniref:olfactomedin-4-like isoform X1 n=1 Tax=Ctenopharyngodon idella TaxID=7959 RepID=UPI002231C391|nr:olfactomedin-4-like isoform X1 [Ctenopharyngodon idella]
MKKSLFHNNDIKTLLLLPNIVYYEVPFLPSDMGQSNIFILLILIPLTFTQSVKGKVCVCDLKNSDPAFPMNKLMKVETSALQCTGTITSQKMTELDRLVLGLQQRIKQLEDNVVMLEKEDDRNLYGAVSLRIIELEIAEIQGLFNKLNSTTTNYQHLSLQTAAQLDDMKDTMEELEKFDNMQVIKKERENQRIKRELEQCKEEIKATAPPPTVPPARCGLGRMVSVVGPRTYSLTVYSTSYPYGAWGRDANPARGDENKYWLVVLLLSNVYGHFVRQYNTLSTLLIGIGQTDTYISSSNPTTNTIQGPNMVMYGNALYYNCYNTYSVCQFNMTTRSVSTVALPKDAGYNNKLPFGHLAAAYSYTDMDFATDESGVYVIYASTSNFGNVIITKVQTSNPPVLGQTWTTSLYKGTVTNTFMVCGVLYATRYLDKETEEIFYSYDTKTKEERFDLKINIKKMQTNIQFLNYDPRDHLLYVYSDAYILTYELIFQ